MLTFVEFRWPRITFCTSVNCRRSKTRIPRPPAPAGAWNRRRYQVRVWYLMYADNLPASFIVTSGSSASPDCGDLPSLLTITNRHANRSLAGGAGGKPGGYRG